MCISHHQCVNFSLIAYEYCQNSNKISTLINLQYNTVKYKRTDALSRWHQQ